MTFYSIAAGLSICLCLVLLVFARFQQGTTLIRSWTLAVTLLSIGFFAAGFAPLLPTWTMVIGSNILLLSAGPILYSCFSAYCTGRKALPDRTGWAVVALTLPAFWYWGLIEPDGRCRSMVFSLATAVVNCRTAFLLGRCAFSRFGGIPAKFMALLFTVLTLWMSSRFVVLMFSAPAAPGLKGANPTNWLTVFGYIMLVSLMSLCVMWMEAGRHRGSETDAEENSARLTGFINYFRNRTLLLWSAITILIVGVVSMLGIGYVKVRDSEKSRLLHTATLANDAFVEHTVQVVNQVDTILRSVRGYYLHSRSLAETRAFITLIGFDRSVIDNIYLIAPDGSIVISHESASLGRSVNDREYFNFHSLTPDDRIFISPVEPGRVTGKHHFRITRRIDNPDGSFGGLVLATVSPESFARYYHDMTIGTNASASLAGILDRKLRARVPAPTADRWAEPIDSPLWNDLGRSSTGSYENTSQFDGIRRIFVFKKVRELPLVMVTGFSDDDLRRNVRERMTWLALSSLVILAFTLMFGLLLTIEVKRREEQAKAVHDLRRSEQRLREAQAIGKIGDWELILATGTMYHSEQLYEMSGRTPDTMPLTISETLLAFHPDDLPKVEQGLRACMENGTEEQLDARHIAPDGCVQWFRYTARPVFDAAGKVEKICGTTQDIGNDKRIEMELIQARDAAESASRAKSEFLATMSHEIRTPLNALIGFSEMSLSGIDEERRREYLRLINNSANMLRDLVNDILDLSRIESGRIELENALFSPRAAILSNLEIFSRQAREKGIDFTMSLPDDIPDALIGDQVRLRQILTNIVGNAVKFTEKGEVRVEVACTPSSSGDGVVVLGFIISDTGIGIPCDRQHKVFEAFSQADSSTTRRFGGTGLGTTISKRLVDLMGGDIDFESEPGTGTKFSISLPFLMAAPDEAMSVTGAAKPSQGHSLSVLVAEDNAYNQRLICDMLSDLGHRAVLAEDGAKAVSLFAGQTFDLILMDVSMPGMNGHDAARAIRDIEAGREPSPSVRIVAVTANARPEDREECLASGMDEVLVKPLSSLMLRQELGKVEKGPGSKPVGSPEDMLSAQTLADFSSSPERLQIYFGLLVSDLGSRLDEMDEACVAGDMKRLAEAAHTAKGVARGLRDPGPAAVAEAIERMAKTGDYKNAAKKLSLLRTNHATLQQTTTVHQQES